MSKAKVFEYSLRMGDNALVLGHRLSEWCGHGPVLEEDIAMINISLDLIGQATSWLEYASTLDEQNRSADQLAFLRVERDYRNVLLTEQPNGHFGDTLARQFLYDVFNYYLYEQLLDSKDDSIKAIAERSFKEVAYHIKHSSEWMIRLGDGTDESHEKIQTSLNNMWRFTAELFAEDELDAEMKTAGIGADLNLVKENWTRTVNKVLLEAQLTKPEDVWFNKGGKSGMHTEHLGFLLAEMQFMQRAYPNMEW